MLAVGGAAFGSARATGVGAVTVLVLLAVHPAVVDAATPRSTRLLLRGGLILLTLAFIAGLSGWTALVTDTAWQRQQFLRQSAVAGFLVLACVCFAVALGRLPRERLRRIVRTAPIVSVLTLVTLALGFGLASRPYAVLGSFTNSAMVALLVFGALAGIVARMVRRHGAAPVAAVGATVLAVTAWLAVDAALASRPEPRGADAFLEPGMSVAVDTGPYVETAVALAVLLTGTVLTVLALAKLSVVDRETPRSVT